MVTRLQIQMAQTPAKKYLLSIIFSPLNIASTTGINYHTSINFYTGIYLNNLVNMEMPPNIPSNLISIITSSISSKVYQSLQQIEIDISININTIRSQWVFSFHFTAHRYFAFCAASMSCRNNQISCKDAFHMRTRKSHLIPFLPYHKKYWLLDIHEW